MWAEVLIRRFLATLAEKAAEMCHVMGLGELLTQPEPVSYPRPLQLSLDYFMLRWQLCKSYRL